MLKIKSLSLPKELIMVVGALAQRNRRSFSAEARVRLESSLTPDEIMNSGISDNTTPGEWRTR